MIENLREKEKERLQVLLFASSLRENMPLASLLCKSLRILLARIFLSAKDQMLYQCLQPYTPLVPPWYFEIVVITLSQLPVNFLHSSFGVCFPLFGCIRLLKNKLQGSEKIRTFAGSMV